ncbi:hypothetical protein BOX15_Mlig017614g1, partial [Macrostomum lignano]
AMHFEANDDLLKGKQRAQSLKVGMKEKVVQLYDRHFSGEDISGGSDSFWNEFFLLRANVRYLQAHFERCAWDELACQKPAIRRLFGHCTAPLQNHPAMGQDAIRQANALQTLASLIRGAFSCPPTAVAAAEAAAVVGGGGVSVNVGDVDEQQMDSQRPNHPNLDLLMPPNDAESIMQDLLHRLACCLSDDVVQLPIKALAINLLVTMATACDLQYNPMLSYLVSSRVFDCCLQLFASTELRREFGDSVCTLLAIMLQAHRHNMVNPCLVKLAVLDDNLVLNGFSYVLSLSLAQYNELYRRKVREPKGLFYSLSNMVGHILVGEEKQLERIEVQDALLLALFEALHVNRSFISTLTYSHTPSAGHQLVVAEQSGPASSVPEPTNLLVVFLEYCSIIMQDTREQSMFNSCKLCFFILTAISEDEYANSLMHDLNMNFRVNLHRLQTRHRAPTLGVDLESAPLACALLDLLVEFCHSHLMRTLPAELYQSALLILHRLLCYQKRTEIRLHYNWHHLWSALFTSARYALSCYQKQPVGTAEPQFLRSLLSLVSSVCLLLNFFVTYGDTFLPTCEVYDLLFYELIRMKSLFEDASQLSLSIIFSDPDHPLREAAMQLDRSLVNIRSIIQHFSPRIDEWAEAQGQRSLTQDQVLSVVRSNYESLTLRLYSQLDCFTSFRESIPNENAYFRQLTRKIVTSVRKDAFDASQQLQAKLKDLSSL